MAKTIKPGDLSSAIGKELELYSKEVTERVNAVGESAVKDLVKRTKASAPVDTGDFKKSIASKAVEIAGTGMKKFIWFVKAPHYRLTHLLVHGHAKAGGGRVPGDPFLENALDEVLPEYEKNVEEAIKG